MPYYGDGLFSRFSFKKLFKAVKKVGAPLLKLAAPLIPGGQFISGLAGGVGGVVKAARETALPFMPLYSAVADIRRGDLPGAGVSRVLAGSAGIGTPGGVAAVEAGRQTTRRARRYTSRRPARRRRRY